jgi:hypothetical protein
MQVLHAVGLEEVFCMTCASVSPLCESHNLGVLCVVTCSWLGVFHVLCMMLVGTLLCGLFAVGLGVMCFLHRVGWVSSVQFTWVRSSHISFALIGCISDIPFCGI